MMKDEPDLANFFLILSLPFYGMMVLVTHKYASTDAILMPGLYCVLKALRQITRK